MPGQGSRPGGLGRALTTILDGHPHLHAPGNSIDVLELLAMPGRWEASRGPRYPDRPASG